MILTVPEYPLYVLAGFLSGAYLYRFILSRRDALSPTNFIWLGKCITWLVIALSYFWASQTSADIITIRNYVRLANILMMSNYLLWFLFEMWMQKQLGKKP